MEKTQDPVQDESLKSTTTLGDDGIGLLHVDPAEERKIVWKLDCCIAPVMAMFYLLSFLDRANIGNARVAGMQKKLGLSDHEYQIAVTVTYIPYILSDMPATLLLRKVGPHILMPTALTLWGVICALQGLVTSYGGLIAARAFLGLAEGPMFPSIVLHLSGFYTRKELALRIALFFSTASLSGAFSGLLASAIIKMDGVGGRPGWAWIFILEGTFTALFGLVSYFLVFSTPSKLPRMFSQTERDIITKRLILDRPTTALVDRFSFLEIWRSLSSLHVILNLIPTFMYGTWLFGLAYFLPTIVNELGFSTTHTQLVSVGPYAAGFVYTLASSYVSDRYKQRWLTACVGAAIAMIGFVIFLCSKSKHVSYGSLFLCVMGTYSLPPIFTAWLANNSEPHYRRASSIGLAFIATNLGGILSTWRYPSSQAPQYRSSMIMNVIFAALIIVFSIGNALYLMWAQRTKERRRAELLAPYLVDPNVPSDGGEKAWVELGDRHPDFRYTL